MRLVKLSGDWEAPPIASETLHLGRISHTSHPKELQIGLDCAVPQKHRACQCQVVKNGTDWIWKVGSEGPSPAFQEQVGESSLLGVLDTGVILHSLPVTHREGLTN